MIAYSEDRKQSIIRKILSPDCTSIPKLARKEGVSDVTLYNWRKQLRERGLVMPDKKSSGPKWSTHARFAVVIETAHMSEAELSEYCRQKGLYPEQVTEWKQNCLQANQPIERQKKAQTFQQKRDKKKIRQLEKELQRKDIAGVKKKVLCPLGTGWGRLTPYPEQQKIIQWIEEAMTQGARKSRACKTI